MIVLAFGLVAKVVPDAELRAATMAVARRFADGSRPAYAYAKRTLNAAETGTLAQVMDLDSMSTILAREANARAKAARKAAAAEGGEDA